MAVALKGPNRAVPGFMCHRLKRLFLSLLSIEALTNMFKENVSKNSIPIICMRKQKTWLEQTLVEEVPVNVKCHRTRSSLSVALPYVTLLDPDSIANQKRIFFYKKLHS